MQRRYDEQHRMPNKKIEEYAIGMLSSFLQKYPNKSLSAPIKIAEILDLLWDFYIDFDNLTEMYGKDTLGALCIYNGERRILIDQSLDIERFPKMLGRYNFSIAHEAGHWVMHAPELLAEEVMPQLIGDKSKPTILCRSSKIDERERQANRFAGYVLMPQELIVQEWHKKFGSDSRPLNVFKELQELREKFHLPPDGKVFCQTARDFAGIFAVSAETMQIRLSELGLLVLEEDNQGYLF